MRIVIVGARQKFAFLTFKYLPILFECRHALFMRRQNCSRFDLQNPRQRQKAKNFGIAANARAKGRNPLFRESCLAPYIDTTPCPLFGG